MCSAPSHPVRFPSDLPISAHVSSIACAIADHPFVIVAGETGSGKTTQLPKICLAMGRGLHAHIGCTQPRRIAATSMAARVASELGVSLGNEVGYKIRFTDRTSPNTYVKFITDGILLAELQGDPMLRKYDTIIVDEAHERSLNIDFLLGCLQRISKKRPELRVVISSATLETSRFSAFFNNAPIIEVSGRSYPVEVVYHSEAEQLDPIDSICECIDEITTLDPHNDILVFLPGEREIHETYDALTGRSFPRTVILPLYGRMPQSEQFRVFERMNQRRIVLATNVAETSLTIPGIVYVVDTGVARINRYNPRNGMTQLLVEPISQASANQRKGRAGRLRSGVCYRLYSEQDFENRPAFTPPEIQRVGLASVILQMKAFSLGAIESFPLLDTPSKRAIDDGYRVLEELGAITVRRELTPIGKKLAHFPTDPRIGRMLIAAYEQKCLRETLIIAAALSMQDPRERPLLNQAKADQAHRQFQDESSDFAGLLKLWDWYEKARKTSSSGQLRRLCKQSFLSANRMREWTDLHDQLASRCADINMSPTPAAASSEAIHRAIVSGLVARIGMWQPENRCYIGVRNTNFVIHPSSGLAKKNPPWVFAAEIVQTSQNFARNVACLDPLWLESIAPHLCRVSYSDPHWQQRPARVVAKQQITVYGLPIVRDRSVNYAAISPGVAREIFLRHALIRHEFACNASFFKHNQNILEQAKQLRSKARRSDMLFDEDALLPFFEARVAPEINNGKDFETWRKRAEQANPDVLKLSLQDVLLDETSELSEKQFPNALRLYGTTLPLTYRFEPGEDDDGVTLTIPVATLAQAQADVLEWMIPGWHEEKILYLLQSLPKGVRKQIQPIAQVAREIARACAPFQGPMLEVLSEQIYDRLGVRISKQSFALEEIPPYLRLNFRIVSPEDRVLAEGRDLRHLQQTLSNHIRQAWENSPKPTWQRDGLTSWSFDKLPEKIRLQMSGITTDAFPALVDNGTSVSLQALASSSQAQQATKQGLRRLLLLGMGETLRKLERSVPQLGGHHALSRYVADSERHMREQLVLRALDEAFGIDTAEEFPRQKSEFEERLAKGRRILYTQIKHWGGVANELGMALRQVETRFKQLKGKPGAAPAALEDARCQLEHLLPQNLFDSMPTDRIQHLSRYLQGICWRLDRLPNNPQRDADKALQVTPIWQEYLEHHTALAKRGISQGELEQFRWLLEELRISLFAPELKTVVSVSPKRIAQQWKEWSRATT